MVDLLIVEDIQTINGHTTDFTCITAATTYDTDSSDEQKIIIIYFTFVPLWWRRLT